MLGNSIKSNHNLKIEHWFEEEHTHDFGATSQYLFFLLEDNNRYYFGNDSYPVQNNFNTLVQLSKETALERGSRFVIIDA